MGAGCSAGTESDASKPTPLSPQSLSGSVSKMSTKDPAEIFKGKIEVSDSTKWKEATDIKSLDNKYHKDGSLAADDHDKFHLEFRSLLDEPIWQQAIGEYAKSIYSQESFFAWTEIQEYRSIPTADFRCCTDMHIYEKYIKSGAVLEVGSIPETLKEEWAIKLEEMKGNKHFASEDVLDSVQHVCFQEMYLNVFIKFNKTEQFKELSEKLDGTYNKVSVEDFEYIAKLGVGGFGRVVHVKKKSTGKHYALKTQLKTALVETYLDNPKRLDSEKTVFAACHHPFIVDMDYAFQTEGHAILVLGLATCGDLQQAIDDSPENRLDETRTMFYSAEIALALNHLHELHLMYRDLKPCNVLLCEDGNCKLADMGGVADFGGDLLYHEDEKAKAPREDFRRKSIMGTHGYMAPEMVKMMGQSRSQRKGYTAAVDYWSLGVTVFKLLTGHRPFDNVYTEESEVSTTLSRIEGNEEFRALHKTIDFPPYISETAKNFVKNLLDVSEKSRLGCDGRGIDGLKEHPFFEGLDWIVLQQRHLEAPYIPEFVPPKTKPQYSSYDDMMLQIDKDEKLELGIEEIDWSCLPTRKEQTYFAHWDFISPHTLKVEMGIASEMDAHNKNFKVKQLLGDPLEPKRAPRSTKSGILGKLLSGKNSEHQEGES